MKDLILSCLADGPRTADEIVWAVTKAKHVSASGEALELKRRKEEDEVRETLTALREANQVEYLAKRKRWQRVYFWMKP